LREARRKKRAFCRPHNIEKRRRRDEMNTWFDNVFFFSVGLVTTLN
jgi:hypothetical protein